MSISCGTSARVLKCWSGLPGAYCTRRQQNWSCRRQLVHRLAASPLSLHPKGGPRSILPFTIRFVCGRSRSPSASPDVAPRHARRAREGPWRFVASSEKFYSLCTWMPKALATELGARTVASRSSAVPTWHAVPASSWCCRRQPAPCTPPSSSVTPRCFKFTALEAFARWLARALLAKAPPSRSGLVVTGVPGCNSSTGAAGGSPLTAWPLHR